MQDFTSAEISIVMVIKLWVGEVRFAYMLNVLVSAGTSAYRTAFQFVQVVVD